MAHSNVIDEFLNKNGLTHTSTAEETDLSAFGVWREKVDNFDPGFEHLFRGRLIFVGRRSSVDCPTLVGFHIVDALDVGLRNLGLFNVVGVFGASNFHGISRVAFVRDDATNLGSVVELDDRDLVHRIAGDVQDSAENLWAHRHGDIITRVVNFHATHKAVRCVHGDGSDDSFTEVKCGLQNEVSGLVRNRWVAHAQRRQNRWYRIRWERNVHNRSNDLSNFAVICCSSHVYLLR